MRALLICLAVLCLANVGVLLWPHAANTAKHIHSSRSDVSPHFIRLNKEIEEKYLNAPPSLSAPNGANENSAAGALPQQNSTEPTELAAGQVALNSSGCYRLGPFLYSANYELAQAVLFNADVVYQKSTRTAQQSDVFRVYLGPFSSQAEAQDRRVQLRQDNILDHFVSQEDNNTFVVSLGIFTTEESARNAVVLYSDKIESVKMKAEALVLPNSYWLHFSIDEEDKLKQELAVMDWGERSAKIGKHPCAVESENAEK